MGLFFWAAKITSILNATLITILLPIPLTIASYFIFRERITFRYIIVSIVAVCGAMLIVASGSSGGTGDLKGDSLAVVAVLISAGYLFSQKTLLTVPLLEFQAGVFAWGGLFLSLWSLQPMRALSLNLMLTWEEFLWLRLSQWVAIYS